MNNDYINNPAPDAPLQASDIVAITNKDVIVENNISDKEPPQVDRKTREREVFDSLPDDEARIAWNEGWRPKELYNGKNKDGTERTFIDYKEFLENAQKFGPVRNERLRELANKNENLERQLQEMDDRVRELLEINKKRENRDLESSAQFLDKEIQKAKEDYDFERYEQLLTEKQKLQKELQNNPIPSSSSSPPPMLGHEEQLIVNDWIGKNKWFVEDVEMNTIATAYDTTLIRQSSTATLPLNQRLELVTNKMRSLYPEKFGRKSTIQMVESNEIGGFGDGAPRKKNYNDLPATAKKTCDWAMKRGIIKSHQQFVDKYPFPKN
jgi:hypothetical protein